MANSQIFSYGGGGESILAYSPFEYLNQYQFAVVKSLSFQVSWNGATFIFCSLIISRLFFINDIRYTKTGNQLKQH